MDFTDKVVLVTGGSSGIGAAIAVKFASHGGSVAIVGRNQTKLKNVSDACERNGKKPLVIVADVCEDDNVKRIVSDTIEHFGKLDILVNNAGIGAITSIFDEDVLGLFDRIMNTNFRSVVNLTHLAVPHIVETKGSILNISSISSLSMATRVHFAYNSSKAALDHFSRSIALELAQKGVRVNTINPGPVKTDIVENSGAPTDIQDVFWENMKSGTAFNRIIEPEEIADLVLFLASDKARSITGSTYVIDSGYLLKGFLEQ